MTTSLARSTQQIGNAVRRVRKQLGLTQTALAQRAGSRQETISTIENGRLDTRIETLLAVLSALDLEFQIVPRSKDWCQKLENDF